jgi:DNA-binding YbaB/EbfC family protein
MDIAKMMKQAQAIQKQLAEQQKELATKEYEATSGGGMVTAKVNGTGTLLSVKIDPIVVDPSDVEMLQDLVVAAVNEANQQATKEVQGGMSGMMEQLGIRMPG